MIDSRARHSGFRKRKWHKHCHSAIRDVPRAILTHLCGETPRHRGSRAGQIRPSSTSPFSNHETPLPHQFPDADSRRILIVDDEEAIRNLFAIALSERYECVTAADTPEALRLLAAQQFALVISDVQMPGLSGVELLRKIVSWRLRLD